MLESNGSRDVLVTKINPIGTHLVYATFLGGSWADITRYIAVDGQGNVYLSGEAGWIDFPVTPGAYNISPDPSVNISVTKIYLGSESIWDYPVLPYNPGSYEGISFFRSHYILKTDL